MHEGLKLVCFVSKGILRLSIMQIEFSERRLGSSDRFFLYRFVDFPPHYVLDLARLVGIFNITWFMSLELLCVSLYVEQ